MEYLEGWELVPGLDDDDACVRDNFSSTKHGGAESQEEILSLSPSPPVSPRLDTQIPTEKENPAPTIIIAGAIDEQEEEEVTDPVSPVFLKETEFVDMKSLESKSKSLDDDDQVTKDFSGEMEDGSCGGGGGEGGFDVWKWGWGLTGIGALMFVLVLGAAGGGGTGIAFQTKNHHIGGGFKGYEENQRLKEMVSAVRGGAGGSVPLTRAHITFGGYYDAPSLNH